MSINKIPDLGKEIKKAIKEKGLNQSAVAKKMNMSKQVINQLDRRKNFDLDFLVKLKKATGLDYTSYVLSQVKDYTHLETVSTANEPELTNPHSIELSLSVKVKGEQINRISDLVLAFRNEAQRLGFLMK